MNDHQQAAREEKGRRLLHAVERFINAPEAIMDFVKELEQAHVGPEGICAEDRRQIIAAEIIKRCSSNAALIGGATSLPAIVPGPGTVAATTGGMMLDMALTLKLEVEMAMALAYLYGFDIRDEKERQIALLLASVNTYDARAGNSLLRDALEAEMTALWNYAPREVFKLILTAMSRLAVTTATRGLIRSIPLVGAVVGASVNKVTVGRVGGLVLGQVRRRFEGLEQQ